jgi:hypothetical protein
MRKAGLAASSPPPQFWTPPCPGSPARRAAAPATIATDGPDRQRQAAESIAAFSADAHPGAIGGHVLFSLNGTRVTLYAEWTSEQAHREAIASSAFGGQRGIFDGKSGIRGLSMNRYQLYRSATPPSIIRRTLIG